MAAATLVIPYRFRGPASSGNGGWVAGALAAFLPGADAVRVRLQSPPPLTTPLEVEVDPAGSSARLVDRAGRPAAGPELTVAVADAVDAALAAPCPDGDPRVADDEAAAAAAGFTGGADHPFPSCFVCSPARAVGDGLRLAPGRLPGEPGGRTAAPWTPSADLDRGDGTVGPQIVWAALDCPGAWTVDLAGRPMVLGTMTAAVRRRPAVGERCLVTGTARRHEGRKVFTTTTLWTDRGERLAGAAAVWIMVDPATIRPA